MSSYWIINRTYKQIYKRVIKITIIKAERPKDGLIKYSIGLRIYKGLYLGGVEEASKTPVSPSVFIFIRQK